MIVYATSLVAGTLATLSPCVLPVVPIMVGSASHKSRFGPIILAAGIISSFTLMGFLFSAFPMVFGVSEGTFRKASAWLLLIFGVILVSSRFKQTLSRYALPMANLAERISAKFENSSFAGKFAIGFLLGAAWSPCVGPTLGAALSLAGTEGARFQGTSMMLLFGIGMSLPFLAIAYGFRQTFMRHRGGLVRLNLIAVPVMGGLLIATSLLTLTGTMQGIEAFFVKLLPTSFFEFIGRI